MSPRGGYRPGAGRPSTGGQRGRNVTVRLAPESEAEMTAALRDGETLSDLLREGGLQMARRRKTEEETMNTSYFVTPAPGYYGDNSSVYSSHRSLDAARKAARAIGGAVVRVGAKRKGDTWLRVYEQSYPLAD